MKRIGRYSRAHDEYYPSHGVLVSDIRLRFRVTADDASTLTLRWSTASDREAVLRLTPPDVTPGSGVQLRRPGRSVSESMVSGSGGAMGMLRWIAAQCSGSRPPIAVVTIAPQSPP